MMCVLNQFICPLYKLIFTRYAHLIYISTVHVAMRRQPVRYQAAHVWCEGGRAALGVLRWPPQPSHRHNQRKGRSEIS